MNETAKGTLKQFYADLKKFGITEDMTVAEMKEHMAEDNREAQFNQIWINRDYNDKKCGYAQVHNNGTPLLKMTGNQIKIYMALMYYSRTSNKIAASAPVLQELTDLSEKTIRKAISGLRDSGFLIVQRPDDPSEPTLYMLNPQVSSCCKVSLQKHKEFEFNEKADPHNLENFERLIYANDKFVAMPLKDERGVIIGTKIERAVSDIKKDGATNTVRTKSKTLKYKTSILQEQPENQDSGANFDFDNDPEIPFNNFNMPKDSKAEHIPEGEQ